MSKGAQRDVQVAGRGSPLRTRRSVRDRGGYLVRGWIREHKPFAWAAGGTVVLVLYDVVAALQPIPEFGRVYAAYGGVFIALPLAWGVLADGFRTSPRSLSAFRDRHSALLSLADG